METQDPQKEKKKKLSQYPWLWYVIPIVIGQQIAGIGGALGGLIIGLGIQKTVRNTAYTKSKKIIYSVLYTILGILVAGVIAASFAFGLLKIFGPQVFSEKNIERGYITPTAFTSYENQYLGVSALAYPEGWTVTENNDEYTASFESPDKHAAVTVGLFLLDEGDRLEYAGYTDSLIQEANASGEVTLTKTGEERRIINNKEWLVFNGIVTFQDGTVFYNRYAIFATGNYDNRQYIQFILESDQEHFAQDVVILDQMLETARFFS